MGDFFLPLCPADPYDVLMTRMFDLLYYVPGLTDRGLERKDKKEREWLWKELKRRKDEENKPTKK